MVEKLGKLLSLVILLHLVSYSLLSAESKSIRKIQKHVTVPADAVKWEPLVEGAELAVLAGDPFNLQKKGVPFIFRVKHKDGFALKPHWHPMDEYITVLSGTMLLGTGADFDDNPDHLEALNAESYAFMPKYERHFFITRGETVIQFQGVGPFRMTFVHPADDPRPVSERH